MREVIYGLKGCWDHVDAEQRINYTEMPQPTLKNLLTFARDVSEVLIDISIAYENWLFRKGIFSKQYKNRYPSLKEVVASYNRNRYLRGCGEGENFSSAA